MRLIDIRLTAFLVFASSVFLGTASANAQCSDGGACTISRHAEAEGRAHPNSVALRYYYGKGGSPDDVVYKSVIAEANLHLFSHARIVVTLPFQWQSGPLGSVDGLGDLIALWEQTVFHWNDQRDKIQVQGGMRLATGNANTDPGLPMSYQPGLGSNDVIVGTSVGLSALTAGLAYQFAGNRNDNVLVRLKRGDQLVAWGGYELSLERTAIAPSITVIKQFQESSVLDTTASSETFVSVAGSDQLQVNIALRVRHEITPLFGAEFYGAVPLRPRDVNVDGLKRSAVATVGLFVTI